MPSLSLTQAEAGDLAEFLLSKGTRNIQAESGALPDFETGRRTIEESGCVNCHAGVLEGTKWVNRLPAGPLESIHLDRECGSSGRVRFAISKDDWLAIRAYLRRPDVSDAPIQEFERLTKQLNCNACHELNGPAVLSFEANQGPPPLSDAGNKLRASWLGQVLLGQKRVRPWMALRMPQFGESVRPLVNDFAAQAGAEAGEGERVLPPDPGQLAAGIKLLGRGEGGLSCISCHDFHGAKPPGDIHGPDMTEMSARIRGDWMRRWLRDPGRIQPGTAMPSFFSESAGSQVEETIAKIIRVLAAGSNLPMPEGIADDAQQYLLLVKNEPVVLRTFIDGSSPRSIAVGLPGAQNYVFDAENCRLRYVWRGDFLDVKPVWSNRGGGKAKILGTKYFTAADWQPIRIGNPESEPKPKFRGYLLVNGVPEFHYDLDGVSVRELIKSAAPGGGLIQSFEIDHPGRELWFVAGENRQADLVCSKGPFANGRVKVSSGEPVRFDVTITSPVGRP